MAVLSLRDDNMTPFFAVLRFLDDKSAQIIMDNKMWTVKREYLEHVFDGEITYVGFKQNKDSKIEELATVTNYIHALDRFKALLTDVKPIEIEDKKDIKKSFELISKSLDDEDIIYAIFDNAVGKGIYLEK